MDFNKFGIKKTKVTNRPNYMMIPIHVVKSVKEFNRISNTLKSDKRFKRIVRTASGGISIKHKERRKPWLFDVRICGAAAEITVKNGAKGWVRIQYRKETRIIKGENNIMKEPLAGKQAYRVLTKGIKLEDIKESKELDTWYIKKMHRESFIDKTISGVNHIDINSAFGYYISIIQPKLKDRILDLYNNRKTNPLNKEILNFAFGCFKKRLPNTWKMMCYMISERLKDEAELIKNSGGVVISYNTDGVWFKGDYKGKIGTELGQVKLDHKNVKIRFKSAGSYEYIEDGQYNSSVSGVKKELLNEWGDIYKHHPKGLIIKDDLLKEVEIKEF